MNDAGTCKTVTVKAEKTKPLPLYTEATLLRDLQRVAKYVKDPRIKALLVSRDKDTEGENGGIGTPATRAEMLKTLLNRNFLYCRKKETYSHGIRHQLYSCPALHRHRTRYDRSMARTATADRKG